MEQAEEDDLATIATFFETGEDTGDPKWTGLCIRDLFQDFRKSHPIPVQVAEHFSFLLLLSFLHFMICTLLCPVLRPRGHSQSS